jgi:hypothetical protein
MNDDNKSPEQLEREVEDSRAQLNNTLNEIRDRMSPGQMVDEALSFAKNNGGADFGRNLATQARDNPLPVLLIGAGIAWLMSGRRPAMSSSHAVPAYRTHFSDEPGLMSRVGNAVSSAASSVSDAVSGVTGAVSGAAHSVGGAVSGAAGSTRNAASGAYGSTRDAASGAYGSTRHAASSAYGSASDAMAAGRDMYQHRREQGQALLNDVSQQPLMVAAIGLAIGAAMGGLLPSTRTEDRWMGSVADDIKAKGEDVATQGYERGREVVKAAVESGSTEAERQGLMPSQGNGDSNNNNNNNLGSTAKTPEHASSV